MLDAAAMRVILIVLALLCSSQVFAEVKRWPVPQISSVNTGAPGYAARLDAFRRELARCEVVHREGEACLDLLKRLSFYSELVGDFSSAERYARLALDVAQRSLPTDHPDMADCATYFAAILSAQDRHAEAEQFYRRALQLNERYRSGSLLTLANSYSDLAGNLEDQGNYRAAEPLHRRAIDLISALGGNDLALADHFNALGLNLSRQRRYVEAETYMRRALASTGLPVDDLGNGGVIYAINLGVIIEDQGRDSDAEAMYRIALGYLRAPQGYKAPATLKLIATVSINLAVNLRRRGRLEEAEHLIRDARSIIVAYPAFHRDRIASALQLAATLQSQGKRAEEARALCIEAERVALKRIDAFTDFGGAAQDELRASGEVFRRRIRASWDLARS